MSLHLPRVRFLLGDILEKVLVQSIGQASGIAWIALH